MTDHTTDDHGPDLALGLEPGHRFRCEGCANLTRFDVVTTERARRFHHLELGGQGGVEEEEILERTVETVTCRWCGRSDAIAVVARGGSQSPDAL
jgi:transposase